MICNHNRKMSRFSAVIEMVITDERSAERVVGENRDRDCGELVVIYQWSDFVTALR